MMIKLTQFSWSQPRRGSVTSVPVPEEDPPTTTTVESSAQWPPPVRPTDPASRPEIKSIHHYWQQPQHHHHPRTFLGCFYKAPPRNRKPQKWVIHDTLRQCSLSQLIEKSRVYLWLSPTSIHFPAMECWPGATAVMEPSVGTTALARRTSAGLAVSRGWRASPSAAVRENCRTELSLLLET